MEIVVDKLGTIFALGPGSKVENCEFMEFDGIRSFSMTFEGNDGSDWSLLVFWYFMFPELDEVGAVDTELTPSSVNVPDFVIDGVLGDESKGVSLCVDRIRFGIEFLDGSTANFGGFLGPLKFLWEL